MVTFIHFAGMIIIGSILLFYNYKVKNKKKYEFISKQIKKK